MAVNTMKAGTQLPNHSEPVHGLMLMAFGHGNVSLEPDTALALYDAAVRHLGIDTTRSVHGGIGSDRVKAIKEDRRSWLRTGLLDQYELSSGGDWATVTLQGQHRAIPLWCFEYLAHAYGWTRSDDVDIQPIPVIAFGCSFHWLSDATSVLKFSREASSLLLADDRVVYGFIDVVSHWRPSFLLYGGVTLAAGSWEQLVEALFWREFLLNGRQHARGVFWGNIFGREMADRLRAAGLHEMLAFNRDFHPRWDAIVIDGEHGGQAILLDDDPVLFAQKRGGQLICHAGVVQNGIVLRAAMMKAGLM
jgi:hypothetical protein